MRPLFRQAQGDYGNILGTAVFSCACGSRCAGVSSPTPIDPAREGLGASFGKPVALR
ncbi:hypothetical protein HRbin30_00680 [bacterium HR30]|nr:hypothetical protein HRbin30_00680 [bacterium HR30]